MGTLFVILWVMTGVIYTVLKFPHTGDAQKNDRNIVFVYLFFLLAWALVTSLLALGNFYVKTTAYFMLDIATFVPFVITGCFLSFAKTRQAITQWIMSISLRQLTWIHVIRILAIGTILKMLNESLPAHFILPVGVPDFIFGLSVPIIDRFAFQRKMIRKTGLILWNTIGLVLFFPTLILIYLSVPSPIQVFFEGPNTFEVFRFPMALVPTFLAPVFIMMHCAAIYKLLRSEETN